MIISDSVSGSVSVSLSVSARLLGLFASQSHVRDRLAGWRKAPVLNGGPENSRVPPLSCVLGASFGEQRVSIDVGTDGASIKSFEVFCTTVRPDGNR